MAQITYDDKNLVVELTTFEKIAGLHGDITVPRSAVQSVTVEAEPVRAVRGIRAPGLAIPGRTLIGTWRRRGGSSFVVARRGQPGLRIELDGTKPKELVVSTPRANELAAALTAGS